MRLEACTRPYIEEMDGNLDQVMELAKWLRENPNAHADLRREKFAAWRKLTREDVKLVHLISETIKQWMKTRMNRPVLMAEVIPEVLRNVAHGERK